MKNDIRAEKLMKEAKIILDEVQQLFKGANWNLAIRRAQEVVELVLKGLLAQLGVDYPKIHDVAPVFKKSLKKTKLDVNDDFLKWLERFSTDLFFKRTPSFYFEAEYDEEEAKEAVEGANKVFEFGKNFIETLKKNQLKKENHTNL